MITLPRSVRWSAAALLGALFAGSSSPAAPPAPPDVLAAMEHVADWQLAHPSIHPTTDWTQGAGYTGFLALARLSASPRFHDAMRRMGEANDWKLGPRVYMADDICVGQAYAELSLTDHDPRMIAPLRERLDYITAHPPSDDLDFAVADHLNRWSWCDSLFMAPPTWLRAYAATGNAAYLDYAVKHWWQTSDFLYNPAQHLFFRDNSYFKKREANGQPVFWSRGNGWVLGGLVHMLECLPPDHPARARFEQQFREMAARIMGLQQPDGFWRSSLLDPDSYPAKETSGTGFFCYALAWGCNHGLLDRSQAEPAALRAWAAINSCVTAEGKLEHVQPIGIDPRKFNPQATEPYGIGAFLLAGSEIYRLTPAAR